MGIKWTSDVGAPLTVTAVNIVAKRAMPKYHDWIVYGMTALGYIGGGWLNWGGDFVKQIGVSSLPLTTDKLYERFFMGGVTGRSLSFRTSRYPAPAPSSPYEGVRLT